MLHDESGSHCEIRRGVKMFKRNVPQILYKYKSIAKKEDFLRVLEVIDEGKIYLPSYDQLNDPLEGAGYNINIQGWAGMSMQYFADEELMPIEEMKKRFRILSLSKNPKSPQLWAHYADNYSGICLCFSTNGTFSVAKRVEYTNIKKEKHPRNDYQLKQTVLSGFYQKHKGWSYEEEWRIVREHTDNNYIHFEKNELVGIILGQNIATDDKRELLKRIPMHIKVIKTRVGYQIPQVHLQPIHYEYDYNGEPVYYLGDIEKYLLG